MQWMALMLALSAAAARPLPVADLPWQAVHDQVMGGRSTGGIAADDDGLRFAGTLSLENNGGFASVRADARSLGLGDSAGLRVTLVGDGRRYLVTAGRADVPLRAGSYRAAVQTRAGELTEHVLPWEVFEPTSFGRAVRGAPRLGEAPDRIVRIGLMLADGTPGSFDLRVRAIERLPRSESPAALSTEARRAAKTVFAAAIRRGVPAFNRGDAAQCRDHYRGAIETVLEGQAGGLSAAESADLRHALALAAREPDVPAAWALRRAMDAVMAR